MRIVIALCFLAVLCTVYAAISSMNSLEIAKLQVKNAIWNVERIQQRLERIHVDITEDTIVTVTKRLWEQMDNYRDYVNLLLESMRREVNNAKKYKRTDAQYCYDTNFWAINKHSDKAYQTATKCQESAEKSIQNSLGFLDNLKSLGDELKNQLNDISLNCYDDDTIVMQSCILSELGRINIAIDEFEQDVKYIEYSALPASNYVVLQATQCLTNAYSSARFESQGAMMSNSRCVRDAIEKNNKQSLIA